MNPEPSPSRRLRWSGHTDRGRVRKNNEDSFLGLQFDAEEVRHLGKFGEASTEHDDYIFAVSDGMGGAMAGEFASRITVEKITHLLPRSYRQSAAGLDAGIDDVLAELFDQIHRALMLLGQSYEECAGMGATLSVCWFTPGRMFFGHIGDSRIYYLPAREAAAGSRAEGGGLRQITHDDTHVGWLFRNGKLNEREARNHPRRNVLQKALGAGNQFVTPQLGAVACEPGDLFLLCTDGVVDGFRDDQLLELLRGTGFTLPGNLAQQLVEAAVRSSGRDNTTAQIIEVM